MLTQSVPWSLATNDYIQLSDDGDEKAAMCGLTVKDFWRPGQHGVTVVTSQHKM